MIITDDTLIADSKEVAAALKAIADRLSCEKLLDKKYAEEIFKIKDQVERLTAALRITKRLRAMVDDA